MTNERDDFVNVKLSAKGEEMCGGQLTIAGGKYHFTFAPGEAQQVTRAEWTQILSKENVDGEPVFELVNTPFAADAALGKEE